jgi:hypothetical protein
VRLRRGVEYALIAAFCLGICQIALAADCDLSLTIPNGVANVHWVLAPLLEGVSGAISLVRSPDTEVAIYDGAWLIVPKAQMVVAKATAGYHDSMDGIVANIQETLDRVSDLLFALLGDWRLGVRVTAGYNRPLGFIVLEPSDDGSEPEIQAELYDQSVMPTINGALVLLESTFNIVSSTEHGMVTDASYLPGVGVVVRFCVYGDEMPPRFGDCSSAIDFVHDVLSRIGDLVFGALPAGESLNIEVGEGDLEERTYYLTITAKTVDAPDAWLVLTLKEP